MALPCLDACPQTSNVGRRRGIDGPWKGGRVFLFGDSSCADDVALSRLVSSSSVRGDGFDSGDGGGEDGSGGSDCLWLFESAVRYACEVRLGP